MIFENMKSAQDVSYDRQNSPVSKSDVKTTQEAIEDLYSRVGLNFSSIETLLSKAQEVGGRTFVFSTDSDLSLQLVGVSGNGIGIGRWKPSDTRFRYMLGAASGDIGSGTIDVSTGQVIGGRRGPSRFDCGSISCGSISANSYKDYTVQMKDGVFANRVEVSATLFSSSTNPKMGLVSVAIQNHATDGTSFTARVYNGSDTALSPSFVWQAFDW